MTIQLMHPRKAFFTIPLVNEEYDYVVLGMKEFSTPLAFITLRVHKEIVKATLQAITDHEEGRNPYSSEEGDKLNLVGLERVFYYIYKKIDALGLPERKTRWVVDVRFRTTECETSDLPRTHGIWTLTGELEDYVELGGLINLQLVPKEPENLITPTNTNLH